MQVNNAGISGVDIEGDASAFEEYVNEDFKLILANGKVCFH